MNGPRASLVGAGKPRDGKAYTAMDADTGELFAVVPLATWEAMVLDAREFGPCADPLCASAACTVLRGLLNIDLEVVA